MATTEAHKKASAKYDAKAYQKKLVRFKPEQWKIFKAYTKEKDYTDNGFIINAIMYCIENDVDLNGYKCIPEQEETEEN